MGIDSTVVLDDSRVPGNGRHPETTSARNALAVELRHATEGDVRAFTRWRYTPPYDVYNIDSTPEESVEYFLAPDVRCHALFDDRVLAGFCTFGHDARVPGGDYSADGLDIGLGVKPELTGRGLGIRFVAAVVQYAIATFDPPMLRVTIARGNIRALRVWKRAGFSEASIFATARDTMGSGEFAILTSMPARPKGREAPPTTRSRTTAEPESLNDS